MFWQIGQGCFFWEAGQWFVSRWLGFYRLSSPSPKLPASGVWAFQKRSVEYTKQLPEQPRIRFKCLEDQSAPLKYDLSHLNHQLSALKDYTITRGGRDVIVMTYANMATAELLFQQLCFAKSSLIESMVVLALEVEVCDTLKERDKELKPEILCILAESRIEGEHFFTLNTTDPYFELMREKVRATAAILQRGVDILLVDADSVITSPRIWDFFQDDLVDLFITWDGGYQEYRKDDWVCAGGFYLRHSKNSVNFLLHVIDVMEKEEILDQDAFQLLLTGNNQVGKELKRKKLPPLNWKILDRTAFLHGTQIRLILEGWDIPVQEVSLLHFNRCNADGRVNVLKCKRSMAAELGVWQGPTCANMENGWWT